MSNSAIARRYATAYFALASEAGDIPAWRDSLARAADVLNNDEVREALRNPRLPLADRTDLALHLCDGVGEPARNLVRLLIERGRIEVLGDILDWYDQLADDAVGVVRAVVTTAVIVTPELESEITAELRKRLRTDVSVSVQRDPAIIGGLVVKIGDRVIDNSIRTHLQQLQAAIA